MKISNIKLLVVIILSILFIYILIHIFRRKRHHEHHHHTEDKSKSNSKSKSKCGSLNCLDMYNYSECPCNKNKQQSKELFTMAQSVFPLHAPTLPAFSQILNENMANITDNYMEHTEANPLTRDFPSQETSTGFFNVKGDALLSKTAH